MPNFLLDLFELYASFLLLPTLEKKNSLQKRKSLSIFKKLFEMPMGFCTTKKGDNINIHLYEGPTKIYSHCAIDLNFSLK